MKYLQSKEGDMKPGDIIKCANKTDCLDTLTKLGEAGYGAVVMDVSYKYIRITSAPEKGRQT